MSSVVVSVRCTTKPWRTRIRFTVAVDGTVTPDGGFLSNPRGGARKRILNRASGFVPPTRLHLTYPESDMNGRRDR